MDMRPRFAVGASIPGIPHYVIADRDPDIKQGTAAPLGRGAIGVVYRAIYKDQLQRAIKFVSPQPGGDEQAQMSLYHINRKFQEEIALLSAITHGNIVKIVDFGETKVDSVTYPYYIMDLVRGQQLDEYSRGASARSFLAVLRQIVDALSHLHSQSVLHMDLKASNVVIEVPDAAYPHAVLLDLGGAKRIGQSDSKEPEYDSRMTMYISSPCATREDRRIHLGKPLPLDCFNRWGVDLDLCSLGRMIRECLDQDLRSRMLTELGGSGLMALEWIAERLCEGRSEDPMDSRYYQSARQVADDLEKLVPEYMHPLGIPELNSASGPVSIQLSDTHVSLSEGLLDVVNHPFFQRLHRVLQLEYTYLTYPGARQSRFEHSLSTLQLARRFMSRLLQYADFRMSVSPTMVQASLLLALLHDVGHYPLSHMFEDFVEPNRPDRYRLGLPVTDESLFRSFVCPDDDDVFSTALSEALHHHKRTSSPVPPLNVTLSERFPDAYPFLKDLMYSQDPSPPLGILQSIINSAIDVDKIAYLSGDSSTTGVPFGRGVDVDGLVQSLVPPHWRDYGQKCIAIMDYGLPAAESIVLARFWMLARVYWHRTNRAVMAMHKYVIADLLEWDEFSFLDFFTNTLFASQNEATEFLADRYDAKNRADRLDDAGATNPLEGLLKSHRHIYKRLVAIPSGPDSEDGRLYDSLHETVVRRGASFLKVVAENIRSEALSSFKLQPGDVVFDIPYKRRDQLGSTKVLVYSEHRDKPARDLLSSGIMVGAARDFDKTVKKARVFISPMAAERLTEESRLGKAHDAVRDYLRQTHLA